MTNPYICILLDALARRCMEFGLFKYFIHFGNRCKKEKVRTVNSFVRSSCTNKSELHPEFSLTKDDKHTAEL